VTGRTGAFGNTKRTRNRDGSRSCGTIGSKSCASAPRPCNQITAASGRAPVSISSVSPAAAMLSLRTATAATSVRFASRPDRRRRSTARAKTSRHAYRTLLDPVSTDPDRRRRVSPLLHCQTKRIRAERSVRSKRITCEEQSMHTTLVGVFENRLAAERAREELLRAGFADDEIDLRTGADDRGWRVADDRRAYEDETQSTVGETVADWFRSLFGLDDDEDVGIYTEAVRRGDSVVTVHTGDQDRVDRAADILEACGSIDIDEQANEW